MIQFVNLISCSFCNYFLFVLLCHVVKFRSSPLSLNFWITLWSKWKFETDYSLKKEKKRSLKLISLKSCLTLKKLITKCLKCNKDANIMVGKTTIYIYLLYLHVIIDDQTPFLVIIKKLPGINYLRLFNLSGERFVHICGFKDYNGNLDLRSNLGQLYFLSHF